IVNDRGMDGEGDDGLRYESRRVVEDSFASRSELRLVGLRTDQDAVTAGCAGWLDDVALEIFEHLLANFGVAQQVSLDDGENRLLGEIVANHRRRVRVNGLVVGDSRADAVGNRGVAGTQNGGGTGDAEE